MVDSYAVGWAKYMRPLLADELQANQKTTDPLYYHAVALYSALWSILTSSM